MITPDRVVSTTCPYCGVGCNLHLHVRDNFIYQVTSPFDAVVNQGNLCVKGRFGHDYIDSPQRVTTPLIRRQPQQPGQRQPAPPGAPFDPQTWRAVSWDEALDYTAERLTEIYQRDGSHAMSVYCCAKATNEDNYLLQKLYRALFRTNNIDHCTRLCHAGSVAALLQSLGSSAMSNTASEVLLSDCFIVTGSNTSENHPIIALQMKQAIHQRGAKLIVIDPRRIELCNDAVLWLPLKPGTNVALFAALAHVIVRDRLYNPEFIAARTSGFEEFANSLAPFTPQAAAEICGVAPELIEQAARMYAEAQRAAIYWGMGISQFSQGTASALGLIHLALLTGHIGRPGTGLNPLRGQNNVQGASDAGAMPFHYPGYMEVDKEENARQWERRWNVEPGGLSRARGLTTTEILSHAHPGGVRALYIMGENPMMTEPNLNLTRQHMQQLEFVVAQDLFINESGAYADVFLPAAAWAEKDGTFTNTDRRIQRVRAARPAPGLARPDSDIICDLARRVEQRLGRPASAGWAYAGPAEVFAEMASVAEMLHGATYPRLEQQGLQYPVTDEQHPGTPYLFAESFPSGRGRFFPVAYVPVAEPPDDEYPLILTTGRVLEHWHGGSMTRNSELNELYPEALLEVHALDAEQWGLRSGSVARVFSRRGQVVVRCLVTEKARPGVVFLPMHFAEAAANLLTIDALDAQAKIPEFKACAVRVEIAGEADLADPQAKTVRGRY